MTRPLLLGCVVNLLLAQSSVAAPGDCMVATDCEAVGARCEELKCTLKTQRKLFRAIDLPDIELLSPVDLAMTSSRPDFHWVPPTGTDLIAVVVFVKEPIFDPPDVISNFSDAVWVWHSKLPGGNVSLDTIAFAQGRTYERDPVNPIDDAALSSAPPTPLASGTYFWGVWAWSGVALSYRSELRTFAVRRESTSGRECTRDEDCDGPSTARCVDDVDYTRFCVIACASDVDCFQGTSCDLTLVDAPQADESFFGAGICRTLPAGCECDGPDACSPTFQLCHAPAVLGCSCSGNRAEPQCAIWFLLATYLGRRRRPAFRHLK